MALRFSRTLSTARCLLSAQSRVNALYKPGIRPTACPTPAETCTRSPCICANPNDGAATAAQELFSREWTKDEVLEAHEKHALFTWTAHDVMTKAAGSAVRGDGVYFYNVDGKKFIDFNAMAMCSNHGHSPDQSIIDAVVEQLQTMPFAYAGAFITPIRAKLGKLLAEIFPGDLNTFMFPSSGAEANEIAIRMARLMTGRNKVFSRYRSYHGATLGSISLTGDQRRWAAEANSNGFIKFFDPYPYSFSLGATEEEITSQALTMLREQLAYEGPHTVAAIFLESVTGTNGILKPPKGYLEGIREICDEFGIIMVCDEVMAGFGRTGKLFGFCHAPSVVPDVVSFAKGVNGAFLPLGGVAVRDHVADHFRKNNVSIGSTYNSHPVALASAYAAVKHMLKTDIVGNSARMGPELQAGLERLAKHHPCIKQARSLGLFGCFDVQKNKRGDFIARVTDPLTPAMAEFKKALVKEGLFTMMRGHTVFTNPPLIINAEQIKEGIDILDRCLPILDDAMED
eukprot:m.302350 g.302350  ORF g.302350 m.302350 type:complete len:513 (-) comp15146_c0_seq1:69-1607(-)